MRLLPYVIQQDGLLPHNALEVAFANDANSLTLGDQLFSFAVFRTLSMTSEFAYILIAYD